ncbi:MAG: hypothetical protein WCI67_14450, partial [Chloroflexales bacterium]
SQAQPRSPARQSETSTHLTRATYLLAARGAPPPLRDRLAEGGIAAAFPAAVRRVAMLFGGADPALYAALRSIDGAQMADYRGALARAIVAAAMGAALATGDAPDLFGDADLRDRTVGDVEQTLGGGATVLGAAQDWLTFLPAAGLTGLVLRPYRVDITRMTLAFLGDILDYQLRRTAIHAAIARHVAAGPTVLLAHSLGAIACADLLLTDAAIRAQVPLLITAGSQAGVLHEIGALGALGKAGVEPTPLPTGFPPWLNLYDRNDMLGFRAAPVFAGALRDVELDSRQPFPHAHNAYWKNRQAWEHILAAIADPANVPFQLR